MSENTKITAVVCTIIIVSQAVFMFVPVEAILVFNQFLRPLIYGLLVAWLHVYAGDARHVRKEYQANMAAILDVLFYGMVMIAIAFLFGASGNALAPNITVVARNLWVQGSVLVLGEIIRFKLIKGASALNRANIVIWVTVALAFGQMNNLRVMIQQPGMIDPLEFFIVTVLTVVAVGVVASYFALEGSFFSVLAVSSVFILAIYIVPVLPNMEWLVWSLVTGVLLLASVLIFRFIVSDKNRAKRLRLKRAERYAKNNHTFNIATVAVLLLVLAFFMGYFTFYPVVVLSESMQDTFGRGSIVFVESVPSGQAQDMVGEGYIIHFRQHNREYVHRVVAFRYDERGYRQYITQGDASDIVDPAPVTQESVYGIVRTVIPFIGWPYIFFRSIFGGI